MGYLTLGGSLLAMQSYFSGCSSYANVIQTRMRGCDYARLLNVMPLLVGYPHLNSLFTGRRCGTPPAYAVKELEATADIVHPDPMACLDLLMPLTRSRSRKQHETSWYITQGIHAYLKSNPLAENGIV